MNYSLPLCEMDYILLLCEMDYILPSFTFYHYVKWITFYHYVKWITFYHLICEMDYILLLCEMDYIWPLCEMNHMYIPILSSSCHLSWSTMVHNNHVIVLLCLHVYTVIFLFVCIAKMFFKLLFCTIYIFIKC